MTQYPWNRRVIRFPESPDVEPEEAARAREVLETLAPDVGSLSEPSSDQWALRRRRPTVTDRAMTGTAMAWVVALPPWLRPHALCDRYPRVANQLAARWDDPRERREAMLDLIVDRRGGRRGFPPDVRMEIEALWREASPPAPYAGA